jgi:5-methylcytosine-specific restriction protein A
MRAAKICSTPGCVAIAVNGGMCDACYQRNQARYAGETDGLRQSARSTRLYDRDWQKIRARWLKLHPFCVFCGKKATEVHHIIPLRDGGTHADDNLRSFCKPHHSSHTISAWWRIQKSKTRI